MKTELHSVIELSRANKKKYLKKFLNIKMEKQFVPPFEKSQRSMLDNDWQRSLQAENRTKEFRLNEWVMPIEQFPYVLVFDVFVADALCTSKHEDDSDSRTEGPTVEPIDRKKNINRKMKRFIGRCCNDAHASLSQSLYFSHFSSLCFVNGSMRHETWCIRHESH